MRGQWGLLLGGALFAVFAVACGGDDSNADVDPAATATSAAPVSTTSAQPTPTPAAPASPTPEAPVLEQRESTAVPRSVRFSDMTYTVTDAVVTNATLRSYDGPEPAPSEDSHLVLHLTVENELNGRIQHFALNFFKLDLAGATADAVQVPGQPVFTAQAATAIDVLIAFEVEEDFAFEGASLIIAEPGTEPAQLPLTGAVPESGYPFAVEAEAGDYPFTSGPCTMAATALATEVDLDARIDGAGSASAIDGSRRVAVGERFLRFDMRVTLPAGTCVVGTVGDALFRLEVDGVARGPVNNVNFLIDPGESTDFQLLYRVPADAAELVLLAGQPTAEVAEIAVTAPSLSPSD